MKWEFIPSVIILGLSNSKHGNNSVTFAEKVASNQRGRPFPKGQSGNPSGKPRGTRARITQLAEKLLEEDRDAIIEAVIEAAKNRDPTAMRLCVERLVPLRKGRPVVFDLPPVKTAADVVAAIGEVSMAMAAGELTTEEASAAAAVVEMHRRAIEMTDIELRLQKLEEAAPK